MSFEHQSDGELLAGFVSTGRSGYFEELFRRHRNAVLHVCRRASGRAGDAEDVVQAVFVTLARRAGELTHMASLAGWLARAAWHTALRHRRASLTRRQHERRAAVEIAAGRPEEMDPQVRQEIEFEVYKALDRLPEVYREPLLQSPAGTIAARLSRGRDMLRRRLAVQGYVVTAVALAGILEDRPARASVAVEGECVREVLAAVASTSGTGRALGAILHPRIAMASGVASSWAMGAATVLISASAFVAGASAGNYVGSYLPLWKAKVFGGSGSASKEQAAEEYPEAAPEAPRPHWTGGSATVPEPGMGVLLAVVGLGLLRRRRGPQPM